MTESFTAKAAGQRGYWIAFEGTDGCGKSTQARRLGEELGAVLTFEPGNSGVGKKIREILLHDGGTMDPRCEALLFAADRAEHMASVVRPNLEAGRHVVSDRSVWSSVIYQGVGRGLGVETIIAQNRWASQETFPDIVVYLRNEVETTWRQLADPDRIEAEGAAFMHNIEKGFQEQALLRGWLIVERGGVDEVAERVKNLVWGRLRDLQALPYTPGPSQ
jgi:dTMP kinase